MKEGVAYQYQYHPQQYSHLQQQQHRSNSGGTTPNASSSHTSTPNHTSTSAPGINVNANAIGSGGPAGISSKRQVRKGYWNRRGDHLTQAGYVVYAPPKHAYPVDLAAYPLDPGSVSAERLESLIAPPQSQSQSQASGLTSASGSPSKSGANEMKNDERVGYMNEHGNFAPWVQRPELPESLPRHGREAEKFVEFVVV